MIMIMKQHQLKRSLFNSSVLHTILSMIPKLCDDNDNPRAEPLYHCIAKLLCHLSSVKSNKNYIPGQTKDIDQLRRKAIEMGVLTMIYYLRDNARSQSIRDMLKTDVLVYLDVADLTLHAQVLGMLATQPTCDRLKAKRTDT